MIPDGYLPVGWRSPAGSLSVVHFARPRARDKHPRIGVCGEKRAQTATRDRPDVLLEDLEAGRRDLCPRCQSCVPLDLDDVLLAGLRYFAGDRAPAPARTVRRRLEAMGLLDPLDVPVEGRAFVLSARGHERWAAANLGES